jgi:hypothetical protein
VTVFSGQHSAETMRRIGRAVREAADAISIAGYGAGR